MPLLPFPGFYNNINSVEFNSEPTYHLAFASFAPLNDDIFIADADGTHARQLLPNPANDYNASFSQDGKWVVFTSDRNGPTDIYRVHPDGTGLEQLTNDPEFDDQAVFSPDGKKIAFVSTHQGQADIYILDIATKKTENIKHNESCRGRFQTFLVARWKVDSVFIRQNFKKSKTYFWHLAFNRDLYHAK